MSRADCDVCDEQFAKLHEELKIYKEASDGAITIIERQQKEIESLRAEIKQLKGQCHDQRLR